MTPAPELRGAWVDNDSIETVLQRTAFISKMKEAHLNTAFVAAPPINGNYGESIKSHFVSFVADAKAAGFVVLGWIKNHKRTQSANVDFRDPAEQAAQVQWVRDLIAEHPSLDGVAIDYIRYSTWEVSDAEKNAAVNNVVRKIREATDEAGRSLITAVFPAAIVTYRGWNPTWEGSVPSWYQNWYGVSSTNYFQTEAASGGTGIINKANIGSPNPSYLLGPSFMSYQQDPVTWLQNGYIEGVMPMQYTAETTVMENEVDLWLSFMDYIGQPISQVYIGLGWMDEPSAFPDSAFDPAAMVAHLNYGRSKGIGGFGIFRWGQPGINDRPMIEALTIPNAANNFNPPLISDVPSPLGCFLNCTSVPFLGSNTASPMSAPSMSPTSPPTQLYLIPSSTPSTVPKSAAPTNTNSPTTIPSMAPTTAAPRTQAPHSSAPTTKPRTPESASPINHTWPTKTPSIAPTTTNSPTTIPSMAPTQLYLIPSSTPSTVLTSAAPTNTNSPTTIPSMAPTTAATRTQAPHPSAPTTKPSTPESASPTNQTFPMKPPSIAPTTTAPMAQFSTSSEPTSNPIVIPESASPSRESAHTQIPSTAPTTSPMMNPALQSSAPAKLHSTSPISASPTKQDLPTPRPVMLQTANPMAHAPQTSAPANQPSSVPRSLNPTSQTLPTTLPTKTPTRAPMAEVPESSIPTDRPSAVLKSSSPTDQELPTTMPSSTKTSTESAAPTPRTLTGAPSAVPTFSFPTSQPALPAPTSVAFANSFSSAGASVSPNASFVAAVAIFWLMGFLLH